MGNDRIGRVEDGGSGAVVLFQANNVTAFIILFKL